jgi:hypothetical protein
MHHRISSDTHLHLVAKRQRLMENQEENDKFDNEGKGTVDYKQNNEFLLELSGK